MENFKDRPTIPDQSQLEACVCILKVVTRSRDRASRCLMTSHMGPRPAVSVIVEGSNPSGARREMTPALRDCA